MANGYIYANQISNFEYLHIPVALFVDPKYKDISNEARLLYGYMLKRTTKESETDANQRTFITCSVDEAAKFLNVSKPTAAKSLDELGKVGLVEKLKRGLGQSNAIYVKES